MSTSILAAPARPRVAAGSKSNSGHRLLLIFGYALAIALLLALTIYG